VPVSLDLVIVVVIAVLMAITAGLYWRENRRAEAGRRDAGQRRE
jgi:hypothetical protein